MDTEKLKEIINDCSNGNVRAMELLYNRFASTMFSVCLRYSSSKADAEDILQDGFIKVFNNVKNYKFKGSFEGWIRRLMINTALQKYKKDKNLFFVEEYFDKNMIEEEEILSTPNIPTEVLLEMVQSLPERYRLVFNLYVLDGHIHQEVAEIMDISIGTAKSNLSRARKILQEKVRNYVANQMKKDEL